MIKIVTATAFSASIEVDEQGKIINGPRNFKNFIGQPFVILEQVLRKNKFQSITVEDVEEI